MPVLDTAQPELEPHTQQFVDSLADAPPIYTLSPADARSVLARAQSAPVGKPRAQIEDTTFPVGPTGSVPVRVVRPADTTEILPAVVYCHGGGWILGDRDTHDRLVREIAVGAKAALIFVDYARAPEARFPVAIEQAYAATCYVADYGADLRIDPSRLAVVGDSVGGNMAAALTLMAKQRRGPKIAFQVLFYPVTDARFDKVGHSTVRSVAQVVNRWTKTPVIEPRDLYPNWETTTLSPGTPGDLKLIAGWRSKLRESVKEWEAQ